MIIDVPDDLTACNEARLRELAELTNAVSMKAHVELAMRAHGSGRPASAPAARPQWAQKLSGVIDSKPKRAGFVILVLVALSLPGMLRSFVEAKSHHQAPATVLQDPP